MNSKNDMLFYFFNFVDIHLLKSAENGKKKNSIFIIDNIIIKK